MPKTRMWQEIQDQADVSKTILAHYMESAPALSEKMKGRTLILTGTGASLNACRAARYAFIRYAGLIPQVLDAYEMLYVLDKLPKDALVILVSQSGSSHETQVIAQALKEHLIEFWGITNNPDSLLAQKASQVLPLNSGEEVSSATKTYSATIQILYMLAASQTPGVLEKLAGLPQDIIRTLESAAPAVERLVERLHQSQVAYIAGLGMLGSTAIQGALMMKEKTFICTEGLPISELRHGTVEALKPGLPVLLAATTLPMVAEALKHAAFLSDTGAEIHLVADTAVDPAIIPAEKVIPIVNTMEEEFSHITAAIPFQLLAEGIARMNGYDVDGFRYLKKVVDQY